MLYLHLTMPTWRQYYKSIAAWIHCIRNKRIQDPGIPPLLTIYHPPNLEYSTRPTKKSCSSKNCTQMDYLPFNLLHNISIWHAGLENHNKLKPVLELLTQKNPVLCASIFYKLKYSPFDYFIHCWVIKYAWADKRLGTHKYNHDRIWEK